MLNISCVVKEHYIVFGEEIQTQNFNIEILMR